MGSTTDRCKLLRIKYNLKPKDFPQKHHFRRRQALKFLSVILLLCVLFGCNTQKEVEEKEVELSEEKEVELSEEKEVELSEEKEVELSEEKKWH